ncbi:MAG: HNH endonuclease, partial [Gammaproteobacteria bacterium]|nr:HNH endonuclease [Gammaproteobacteria bacterium]
MATKRKPIKVDIKHQVLHESGYKCSNPVCRTILTLDIHHLEYVSKNGDNTPDNLLALCPNCHALHHKGIIPDNSL